MYNGKYDENQSHVFVNVSVMHKSLNQFGEVEVFQTTSMRYRRRRASSH